MVTASIRLHGVPLSQPFRSVAWAMLQKRVPFDVSIVVPGASKPKNGSRNEAFLKINPTGSIPMLTDTSSGISLFESPAILTYLAERHGWDDLLPRDLALRSRV